MAQGTVKSYDPISGTGWLLDDHGEEVPLAPNALEGSIFIMLRQGQRVVYRTQDVAGVQCATALGVGQDSR